MPAKHCNLTQETRETPRERTYRRGWRRGPHRSRWSETMRGNLRCKDSNRKSKSFRRLCAATAASSGPTALNVLAAPGVPSSDGGCAEGTSSRHTGHMLFTAVHSPIHGTQNLCPHLSTRLPWPPRPPPRTSFVPAGSGIAARGAGGGAADAATSAALPRRCPTFALVCACAEGFGGAGTLWGKSSRHIGHCQLL